MKERERSFLRQDTSKPSLALISGGSVRVASQGAGDLLFWHGPQHLSGRINRLLPRRIRNRQSTMLFGLGCEMADEKHIRLLWQRDRPETSVTVSELRSVKRELTIRGREALRRDQGSAAFRVYLDSRVEAVAVDGRRVVNPVGFKGREVVIEAAHLYVDEAVATFLETVRQAAPRVQMFSLLLDRLAADVVPWTSSGTYVFVGEGGTVVRSASRPRKTFGVGEEAVFDSLQRSGRDIGIAEVRAYRSLQHEKDLRTRELTTLTLPAMRRWARGVETLLLESLGGIEEPEVPVVFGFRVPVPFAHIFKPQVKRHVFERLSRVNWVTHTLPELLARPDCRTIDESYAALLNRAYRTDPYMTTWT